MIKFAKAITVAVVGPHYAGKTLLCKMFHDKEKFVSIEEKWWQDPFRKLKPRDYFRSQLWYLTKRLTAIKKAKELNSQGKNVVLDTFYYSTLIFGETKLNPQEQKIFKSLMKILVSYISLPNMVIYLYADSNFLFCTRRQQRIEDKSGPRRDKQIQYDWYKKICFLNKKYFSQWKKTPLISINIEKVDFINDTKAFPRLMRRIQKLITK